MKGGRRALQRTADLTPTMEDKPMSEAQQVSTTSPADLAEARHALESALSEMEGISDLLAALAACSAMIHAPALGPVEAAFTALRQQADAAFATLFPALLELGPLKKSA